MAKLGIICALDCEIEMFINDFNAKLIRGGTELYQKKLKTDFPVGQLIRLRCRGEFIALGRVTEYEKGTAVKPEKLFVL